MGADEFMEWMAYYQLLDPDTKTKLESQLLNESPIDVQHNLMRSFLNKMTPPKKKHGK